MFPTALKNMLSNLIYLDLIASVFANPESFRHRSCKCGPDDSSWPSLSLWAALNSSLSGKLIADTPVAESCYPGQAFDSRTCASIGVDLTSQTFVSDNPIALSYPTDSCPPINLPCSAGDNPTESCPSANVTGAASVGTCSIGDQPRYTVNATEVAHVATGINFARQKNLRLVVRNTGHDILRRSTGYGSLQIWIRYLRKGITFQEKYIPSDQCHNSTWKDSAFTIGGGYIWEDVLGEAAHRNVVVVSGGTPTVGCLGGWMQGGGHGPAVHDFGLGADQVLEAQVVLASGETVTASPCQNSDLLFAIRGGGPSSYGVVVSTVIKAHPTTKIAAQVFGFAPLTPNDTSVFMDAINIVYQAYPDLSDKGFSGYGSWSLYSPTPLVGNYSTGFIQTIAIFGKTAAEAESLFAPVPAQLQKYNGTKLFMTSTYYSFPTFDAYYYKLSNIKTPVGQSNGALGSRLLGRSALTGDVAKLKKMLAAVAGKPEQATSNNIVFVGGGQVFKDASDPYSGINPAWRQTYVHNIVARGWAPGASDAVIQGVHSDITNIKVQAMKDLAPDTGSYMNEGDRFDPHYLQDFYGANLGKLWAIKRKYDPQHLFYCPTCIGSKSWQADSKGKLCPSDRGNWYEG